jgi:subtilisin family serine protease
MKDTYFYYNYDKKVHFDVSNISVIKTVNDINRYSFFEKKQKRFDQKFIENVYLGNNNLIDSYLENKEFDNLNSYKSLVLKNGINDSLEGITKDAIFSPSSYVIIALKRIDFKSAKIKLEKVLKKHKAYFLRKMTPHILNNCYVIKSNSGNRLDTLDMCVDLKEGFSDIVDYAIPDLFAKFTLNAPIINDPLYNNQWYLKGNEYPRFAGCNLEQAWEVCSRKRIPPGKGINVAVLDTGNYEHEDLPLNSLFFNKSVIDGHVNPIPNNGMYSEYHGTAISTIIKGKFDNGIGGAGIAAYANLVAIKTLPIETFQFSAIATALDLAKSQKCKVVNLSFGTTVNISNQHLDQVIENYSKDALICCSSGNYKDSDRPQIMFPATSKSVFTIGACDNLGRFINGGGFGFRSGYLSANSPKQIDLVAPGYKIVCGKKGNSYYNTGNDIFSGTSASSAIVAGIATLLLSIDPRMSINNLKRLILDSCDFTTGQEVIKVGKGRINAGVAASKL